MPDQPPAFVPLAAAGGSAAPARRVGRVGPVASGAALGGAALATSLVLHGVAGRSLLFLLLLAIGVAAGWRGRRAGLAATAVALAGAVLLFARDGTLVPWSPSQGVTLLALGGAGALLATLIGTLRERLARVEALDAELRAANAALAHAHRQAEEASRAKGDFLNVMSHELRTPLNAVGGYAELMLMELAGPVTPQQRDYLTRIKRSQGYLLGLVNRVLQLARLDAGAVAFQPTAVPLARVAATVDALLRPQATLKGLTFAAVAPPAAVCVRADADRLEQVLVNLLANAVKFTPAGGRVQVTWTATADTVLIAVHDTGIGIPADRLEAVFDPFVQVASGASSAGTGLGLAISRQLVTGMGGTLAVRSTPGVGSVFTVALPRADDTAAAEVSPVVADVSPWVAPGTQPCAAWSDGERARDTAGGVTAPASGGGPAPASPAARPVTGSA